MLAGCAPVAPNLHPISPIMTVFAVIAAASAAFTLPARWSRPQINRICGQAEYAELVEATKEGQPAVIRFSASHCTACKALEPRYEALARTFPGVTFTSVTIEDDNEKLMRGLDIKAIPFIHIVREAETVDRFHCSARKVSVLEAKLEELDSAAPPPGPFGWFRRRARTRYRRAFLRQQMQKLATSCSNDRPVPSTA